MVNKFNLPQVLRFNWDKANLDKNRFKHNVIPGECEELFYDQAIFFDDDKHSLKETRFLGLGKTSSKRHLTIVFTIRESQIRVISARDQNKKEKQIYAKQDQ